MGLTVVSSLVMLKITIPIPVPVGAFVVFLIGGAIIWALETAEKRTDHSFAGPMGVVSVITIVLALTIGIEEVTGTGGASRLIIAAIISFAVGGLVAWGGFALLGRMGKASTSWRFIPIFLGLAVAIVMLATA